MKKYSGLTTSLSNFFFSRQRLTILNAGLCIAVIIGVILVVQPSFLFRSVAHLNYPMYSLGVIIALLCAFSAALINVSSAKLKTAVSR